MRKLSLIVMLFITMNALTQKTTKIKKYCNDFMCLETEYSKIVCKDGKSTITNKVTGGQEPYTYVYLTVKDTVLDTLAVTIDNSFDVYPGLHRVRITDSEGHTIETKIKNQTYSWISIQDSSIQMEVISDITYPKNKKSNGKIKIEKVKNGKEKFTYVWSNGEIKDEIKRLKVGDYSVVITDGRGCTVTENYTLSKFKKSLTNVDRSIVEDSVENSDQIFLGLNYPNPAENPTKIQYVVPSNSKSYLHFVNESGDVKIKKLDSNESIINIDPTEFRNGKYYYYLYVDGRIIENDSNGDYINSHVMLIINN